jgi:hypothetical protein
MHYDYRSLILYLDSSLFSKMDALLACVHSCQEFQKFFSFDEMKTANLH